VRFGYACIAAVSVFLLLPNFLHAECLPLQRGDYTSWVITLNEDGTRCVENVEAIAAPVDQTGAMHGQQLESSFSIATDDYGDFYPLGPGTGSRPERSFVSGHWRNGSYVSGHYRSKANNTTSDNWSTRGNTNPVTSKRGYRNR